LAQRHDPATASAFASIEPNNPHCDDLISLLNKPFDERQWDDLNVDTRLFKLTWKQDYSSILCGCSFYSELMGSKW
jgi:hypothetical protein